MKIYVVRHGLTNYNKLGKLNGGRTDEPLEPEGIEQAQLTAHTLPTDIVKMYVSPMVRTRQTADILNEKLGLPLSYHEELREVDFGVLTSRTWADIAEEYGNELRESYVGQRYDFTTFEGDKVETVKERVQSLLAEIKANHPNENVLLVTHGGILRALYHIYHGMEIEGAQNASVHEFEI